MTAPTKPDLCVETCPGCGQSCERRASHAPPCRTVAHPPECDFFLGDFEQEATL